MNESPYRVRVRSESEADHERPEVRAADPDVHHVRDPFTCVALPLLLGRQNFPSHENTHEIVDTPI